MSFGKFLLGGVCAAGAIIAAPIVVPAAGLAIAGSAATGMAGLTLGLGMASAAPATVATVAGVVAGAAGVTAGAIQEKQVDDARYEGQKSGYNAASKEYENKFRKQVDAFTKDKTGLIKDLQARQQLIDDLILYIRDLEQKRDNNPNSYDSITPVILAAKDDLNKLEGIA